jgi:L-ascorbate metabolism protein UlaG (beta-lactamase superfamily)
MRNFDPAIAAEGYDWGDRVNISGGVAITLVAARHWSARNLSDRNMALWTSFVIEALGGRIYFVADSGYGDGRYFRSARERTARLNSLFCRLVLMSPAGSWAITT